jgi:3',5'-nucleoside bisphosphate phosphatase
VTIYDLHSHSNFSDGVLPPHEVVARANQRGVDVLALTDHDSLAGLDAACDAAREHGMTLIPGVEISVTWEKYLVHIVGLCVDRTNATLRHGLAQLQDIREQRAQHMAQRLEKHGVPNALAGALKHAPNGLVTRRHFALHMLEIGIAPTLPKIFERYLRPSKPGYVATQWAALADTVGWINAAGGVAVIAHPQRYDMSATTRRRLAEQFSAHGGVGIEVVCGGCGQDMVQSSAALAQRFGLLASVGSDFHDPSSSWTDLGKLAALPPNANPIWSHARFSYK